VTLTIIASFSNENETKPNQTKPNQIKSNQIMNGGIAWAIGESQDRDDLFIRRWKVCG
jgi:hypothetical protein